jgi:DNA-directed RNA polymerase sigma subunit (sigma70/sigma32)
MSPPRKSTYHTTHDTGGMTYHQIGTALGISHTRVQQIERKALGKLRPLLHPDLIPDDRRGWTEPASV